MDKQRLLELAGITEARHISGHIGTLTNTVSLGNISFQEAEKLELLLRRPEIGWHTTTFKNGNEWFLRLTINVDRDNLE